ncbi:MAG: hypothetical protein M3Q33_11045 [Acidobacteriota bacterium]|nr:hypothetical protein [Acidobacteriota bacterium]
MPFIKRAAKRGELPMQDYALLFDRVLVSDGKPQIYGTQAKLENGRIIFFLINDAAKVDKRRKKIGLPPLAEYLKELEEIYRLPTTNKIPSN